MNKRTKLAHHRNRVAQNDGHTGRAAWRSAPATEAQLEALRKLAMDSGRTFTAAVNRGEAWRRIRESAVLIDERLRLRCAPPWYTADVSPPASSP